jgi:hypothetical protein
MLRSIADEQVSPIAPARLRLADFGALANSLIPSWDVHEDLDWTDRLAFLSRA